MSTEQSSNVTRSALWTSRVLFAIVVLFLLFDSVGKFMAPKPVVEAFARLGIPLQLTTTIGIILLVCVVLYVIPRTAILGAVLLTGYLGGAVAIHLRAGSTLFEMVFPVIIALMAWGALYLRDPRVRQIIPIRAES